MLIGLVTETEHTIISRPEVFYLEGIDLTVLNRVQYYLNDDASCGK